MAADYYQVLGVARSATADEIRKAYKRIARENHPDLHPDDKAAAERFKQASEAYEVLGDKEKRQQYDQFGSNWKHASEARSGPFRGGQGSAVDIDFSEMFGGAGGVDLGDLFGSAFGTRGRGGARSGRGRSARGEDLQVEMRIPFHLAALGGDYDLTLDRGQRKETITIKVPAGIRDGGTIRLAGQGSEGTQGGAAGDLRVVVQVAPHPYFRRDGNDLLVDLPLTITEAALGGKVDVPTLRDGIVSLSVPAGTSSGTRLRLAGKGFDDLKTKARGDQYAVVKVVVPRRTTSNTERLLRELATELTDNPRSELW